MICKHLAQSNLISQLPDGRIIKVGGERFEAPECLFQPHLVNVESPGIAQLLYNTIQVSAASYSICRKYLILV